jgi:hypothetical protein
MGQCNYLQSKYILEAATGFPSVQWPERLRFIRPLEKGLTPYT